MGVRIARKHVGWYLNSETSRFKGFTRHFNQLETLADQLAAIESLSNKGNGSLAA